MPACRIEDQLVVNLVSEEDEPVAARQFQNSLLCLLRVHRARGIVGIDQQNGPGAWVYAPFEVADVGLPVVTLIEVVGIGHGIELGQYGAIQRILRAWRQDVVSRINKCSQATIDDLPT